MNLTIRLSYENAPDHVDVLATHGTMVDQSGDALGARDGVTTRQENGFALSRQAHDARVGFERQSSSTYQHVGTERIPAIVFQPRIIANELMTNQPAIKTFEYCICLIESCVGPLFRS